MRHIDDFAYVSFGGDLEGGGMSLECSNCGNIRDFTSEECKNNSVSIFCSCGKELIYSGKGDW